MSVPSGSLVGFNRGDRAILNDVVSFMVEPAEDQTAEGFHRWVCQEIEATFDVPFVLYDVNGGEWSFYYGTVKAFTTHRLGQA